jgi:hypothetical protein
MRMFGAAHDAITGFLARNAETPAIEGRYEDRDGSQLRA